MSQSSIVRSILRAFDPSSFRAEAVLGNRTKRADDKVRPTVVIVGPAPGQAGGISSVMAYLDNEIKDKTYYNVIFLNTMRRGRWSIVKFIGVVTRSSLIIARSKLAGRPLMFHLNVSIAGSTYRKWFISCLCRLSSTPYIVHLHGGRYKSFFAQSNPALQNIILSLFGTARKAIVLGTVWRDYVVKELRVNDDRVAVIANGTPAITGPSGSEGVRNEKLRLVYSGRISEEKGIPELIEATDRLYKSFRNFELVLMGDSRDEKLLEQATARPYCIVTGWLEHAAVVRELASSHIFILPSHDEGLPMAMIEAMSLGLPVIVTAVGAIPDVVDHGHEGFLISPGDVEALSEAINLLVMDGHRRGDMGAKAYRRWRSQLDSSHMAQLIEHQWDAVLGVGARGETL